MRPGKSIAAAVCLFICAGCDHAADVPGVLLSAPNGSAPSVILSYPSLGTANIPSSRRLFLEFNQDMDAESAQGSFSLTGSGPSAGRFEWEGRRRLIYELESSLPAGNTYVMLLSSGAKSKEGAAMHLDYIVHFTVGSTVQVPSVISTNPAASAQGVSLQTPVTFVFSRQMDRASTQNAFSLAPSAAGTFTWTPDNTSFTYQPSGPLTTGTTYTAAIAATAKDEGGVALGSGFSISFQVGNDFVRPTVSSVNEVGNAAPISNNQAGIYKDSDFLIVFSEPMEAVVTRNAVTLTRLSDGSNTAFTASWNTGFTRLTLNPLEALEPGAVYRLTVNTSAKDACGNALQNSHNVNFTVDNTGGAVNSEYLKILSAAKVSPLTAQALDVTNTGVTNTLDILGGPTMRLEIVFSHPLDLSTVGDNIFITKILGSCSSPVLSGISFWDQPPGTNNLLRLDFTGMSTCEYELKLLGTRNEMKSRPAGTESGTWMKDDMKFYIKGN